MRNPLTSVWTVLICPVLITYIFSQEKKKYTKLSMRRVFPHNMSYQEIRGGH
ncbi:unnamed protein product [Staurois parvus]|uniref:ATP synthase F0 subunit 8 n=1 Tax=Staurois parvus TaxID=386267 RepID=A0ABN9G6I9_9NEOB|nr:unnamed protein product [Staurois parvus]